MYMHAHGLSLDTPYQALGTLIRSESKTEASRGKALRTFDATNSMPLTPM